MTQKHRPNFGINKHLLFLGKENLKKYWEMLVEYPDAYETATNLWNEIQPLYNKLHEFVKNRLTKHYPELYNLSNIPVYLLGKFLLFSNIFRITLSR